MWPKEWPTIINLVKIGNCHCKPPWRSGRASNSSAEGPGFDPQLCQIPFDLNSSLGVWHSGREGHPTINGEDAAF